MPEIEINTAVSPMLHPAVVDRLDATGEMYGIEPTRAAFALAYDAIGRVHAARETVSKDPTLTENAVAVQVADFADRQMAAVTRAFDAARSGLVKTIEHMERELSAPVTSLAAQSVSEEIRAHVKGLPDAQRAVFVKKAIDRGDAVTASAVLGAPAYLSGLDDAMCAPLLQHFHVTQNPVTARRLKTAIAAREMIEARASVVINGFEQAIGVPFHKVKLLREAQAKTRAALA